MQKPQLMPCGLVPSPSVSSWTPLGPTRNSSGSKKKSDSDLLLPSATRTHVPAVYIGDLWLLLSFQLFLKKETKIMMFLLQITHQAPMAHSLKELAR